MGSYESDAEAGEHRKQRRLIHVSAAQRGGGQLCVLPGSLHVLGQARPVGPGKPGRVG